MEAPRFQWRWFWIGLLALLALWLLWRLWHVLLPFFLAAGFAYLLNPLMDWLEARGLSRNRAILLVLVLLLGLAVLLGFLIVPRLTAEISNIIGNYPTLLHRAEGLYQRALLWIQTTFPWTHTHQGLPSTIRARVGEYARTLQARAPGLLSSLLQSVASATFLLLLSIVLTFWILKEFHTIGRRSLAFVPPLHRPTAISLSKQINQLVGAYLGGQLVLAAIAAVVATLILLVFRVDYAIFIGLLAGALYLIPYIGVPSVIVISVIVSALTGNSWISIVGMVGCFIVLNLLMDYVISPRLIGKRVQLHPMTIILAVVSAGALFGFLGVLIAVPLAAAVKAILATFFPEFFGNGHESSTPAG